MLGDYVLSYEGGVSLPVWVLALTILSIWAAMTMTSLFLVKEPYLQLILVAVAVIETIVLSTWNKRTSVNEA